MPSLCRCLKSTLGSFGSDCASAEGSKECVAPAKRYSRVQTEAHAVQRRRAWESGRPAQCKASSEQSQPFSHTRSNTPETLTDAILFQFVPLFFFLLKQILSSRFWSSFSSSPFLSQAKLLPCISRFRRRTASHTLIISTHTARRKPEGIAKRYRRFCLLPATTGCISPIPIINPQFQRADSPLASQTRFRLCQPSSLLRPDFSRFSTDSTGTARRRRARILRRSSTPALPCPVSHLVRSPPISSTIVWHLDSVSSTTLLHPCR